MCALPNNLAIRELAAPDLAEFCKRWEITELALFGSALRPDFQPDSDVDLLVVFSDDARWSLIDHVAMQKELEEILGREVDLISRRAVENSPNAARRKAILNSAVVLYSAP